MPPRRTSRRRIEARDEASPRPRAR
jgi:hypothetical protein